MEPLDEVFQRRVLDRRTLIREEVERCKREPAVK
jgi:hypothetical protein